MRRERNNTGEVEVERECLIMEGGGGEEEWERSGGGGSV